MSKYTHILFKKHWQFAAEVHFALGQCQAIIAAISEMPLSPEYHKRLLSVSLVKGAQATTAIEGNSLTQAEIERVAQGKSLPPSKQYQEREVANVLGAMNTLLLEVAGESRSQRVTPALLLRFHKMIGRDLGEHFDAIPGRFRTDDRVVATYRCPDPADVPQLVEQMCNWLAEEFQQAAGKQDFTDAVVHAIVAHVYLEWIHPFGDGNGRTGRLLEFYVLLRAGNPDIASHILSNFYNLTRPEYYRQLDKAGKTRDLTEFIAYAIVGFRDGLLDTLRTIQEDVFATAWRSYIHERFTEEKYRRAVSPRRRKLALGLPLRAPVPLDKIPSLNADVAALYGGLSLPTLLRDLGVLVSMDLARVTEHGYVANSDLLRLHMAQRLNG